VSRVEFHEDALAELLEAATRYEFQARDLGQEFLTLVERTYTKVQDFPEIGRPFGRRIRRIIVPRFPYALLYRATIDRILIVAVMHLHRRPGYWRSRVR
jgi:plasmid stabilization system protein ParE